MKLLEYLIYHAEIEDYGLVFEAMPSNSAWILPDSPTYTVIAVVNRLLK